MKLGRLLLRSLQASPRKKKKKPARVFTKPARKKKRTRWLSPEGKPSKKKQPEAAAHEPVATAPASVPTPAPAVPVVRAPEPTPQTQALDTVELIRPNDQLRQSIEAFLMDQRSPHTQRAYGKDLKRFVQFLLTRKFAYGVERINRTIVIAYKDFLLADGLEHTTIDRHLATLKSFFAWLVEDGILTQNPAEKVRFLNPKRISKTIGFTDEEVRKLLKQPNLHTRTGAMHYAILMVLFYCGLRRSELCSLRTSSLGTERDHKVIRLRGKGNAERIIPVIPPVWNAIQYYSRITRRSLFDGDNPLFTPVRNNRTGDLEKALDPSMIFYVVTKYARMAGIANRVSPHSCRATAISNARDQNVPDRAIQEFAGWASPDMITRYDKRKTAVENSAALSIHYGDEGRDVPSWPTLEDTLAAAPSPSKTTPAVPAKTEIPDPS